MQYIEPNEHTVMLDQMLLFAELRKHKNNRESLKKAVERHIPIDVEFVDVSQNRLIGGNQNV